MLDELVKCKISRVCMHRGIRCVSPRREVLEPCAKHPHRTPGLLRYGRYDVMSGTPSSSALLINFTCYAPHGGFRPPPTTEFSPNSMISWFIKPGPFETPRALLGVLKK